MKNIVKEKIDNFGNLSSLDLMFTRIAREQFVTHRFSKEYRTVLIFTVLLDLVAVFVSVFGGYFHLYSMVFRSLNDAIVSKIVSISVLIILEILVHIALAKFFKSFIKEKMQVAFIALVFATILWGVIFDFSTKGLSMRQSAKVSKVETITMNFDAEKENLRLEKEAKINDIKELQKQINSNPTKWSSGKLSLLSADQLASLKELQNEISTIEQTYRNDIVALQKVTDKEYKQDELSTQNEAREYYNIVVAVMFIELLASGFLMFSWSMVLKENKPEDFVNSKINDIANEIDKGVSTLFQNRVATLNNGLTLALSNHSNNSIPFEYETTTNKPEPEFVEAEVISNKKNKPGFKMQTSNGDAKKCAYCDGDISDKKHWNAKYCSPECRIKSWENKHNTTLRYKRK